MVSKLKVKHSVLMLMMAFGIMLIPVANASAVTWICFGPNNCFWGEGSCDGWVSGSSGSTCQDCAAAIKPETDFILVQNSHVWLVQGDKRTPMASDKLMAFLAKLKATYSKEKKSDAKIQRKIDAEVAAFRKSNDPGTVSKKRLEAIAKESGLKIRTKA